MNEMPRFEVEEPSPADVAFLEDQLYEFNAGTTGIGDGRTLLMALWRGSDWNPSYQVSTWSVIRGYKVAGLLGGLAFGLLRPLFWGRVGGAVLGLLLGPLVYGAVATLVEGASQFGAPSAIIPGLLVGAITGWWLSRPGELP